MQVNRARLSAEERQRRRRENLCLYCGASSHLIAACPTRPGNSLS